MNHNNALYFPSQKRCQDCSVEDLSKRAMGRRNLRSLPVKTLGVSRPYRQRTSLHRPLGKGSQ